MCQSNPVTLYQAIFIILYNYVSLSKLFKFGMTLYKEKTFLGFIRFAFPITYVKTVKY